MPTMYPAAQPRAWLTAGDSVTMLLLEAMQCVQMRGQRVRECPARALAALSPEAQGVGSGCRVSKLSPSVCPTAGRQVS